MKLNTEHQVTLTTCQCAALLSAAKVILNQYSETGTEGGEHSESLSSAVTKIMEGMGLSPAKAAILMSFMMKGNTLGEI